LRGAQVAFLNVHKNLDGYQLKVAHPTKTLKLLIFPWFYAGKNQHGGDYYEGTDIRLLDVLSQQMNFDYILHESIDGSWGSPGAGPNGTSWGGMIGMVERNVCFKRVLTTLFFNPKITSVLT
jgi:hypothetical protein